jgi:hypothetical protein
LSGFEEEEREEEEEEEEEEDDDGCESRFMILRTYKTIQIYLLTYI